MRMDVEGMRRKERLRSMRMDVEGMRRKGET